MRSSWMGAALGIALLGSLPAIAADIQKGDLHLAYQFTPTGETMGYRLFVPSGYDGKTAMPLVVVLHGSGEIEDAVFDRASGPLLKQLAEQHGYLVLAPRGYSAFGGYGDIYPVVVTRQTALEGAAMSARRMSAAAAPGGPSSAAPRPPPGPRPQPPDVAVPADDYVEQPKGELSDTRSNKLSEQELFAALEQVRQAYTVDASRIYLMGNSMGGVGAAYLAVKYPQTWAAVAPAGGPVAAWSYPFERLRAAKLPVLFVHGEFDEHANPHWSEALASAGQAEGADTQVLVVKGGHHGDAWVKALPQIFDFFAEHGRRP